MTDDLIIWRQATVVTEDFGEQKLPHFYAYNRRGHEIGSVKFGYNNEYKGFYDWHVYAGSEFPTRLLGNHDTVLLTNLDEAQDLVEAAYRDITARKEQGK